MALLTYTTNIRAWYRGESFYQPSAWWQDMVAARNLGNPSLLNSGGVQVTNGGTRPYLHYSGLGQFLEGQNADQYITASAGTFFVAFRITGTITGTNLVSPAFNETIVTLQSPGYFGMSIRNTGGGVLALQGYNFDGGTDLVELPVSANTWNVASWRHDSQVRLALNDPSTEISTASGATTSLAAPLRIAMSPISGGNVPYPGDIGEMIFYNASLAADPMQQVFNYLLETWGARGDPLEQARDIASRRLLLERKPLVFVSYEAPLEFLDNELGTDLQVSHERGIWPDGVGWRDKAWQRGNVRLLEEELNLDELALKHVSRDLHETMEPLYSTFEPLAGDQPRRRGSADARSLSWRSSGGGSKAWSADPGSGLFLQGLGFAERVAGIHWASGATGGLFCEGKDTNYCLRSSFVSGLGGWTFTGTGAGGRTATAVTTAPLFFDPVNSDTSQALELNHGSSAGIQLSGAPPSVTGGGNYLIVVWRNITGSATLQWRIKDTTNNVYFNDGTGGWQAGSIWNNGTVVESRSDGTQVVMSKFFNRQPMTVDVGTPSTTIGAVQRVYHVQVQQSPLYTSPIINDVGSFTTREAQGATLGTPDGTPLWPAPSWTLLTEIIPAWSLSNIASSAHTKYILSSSPVFLSWKVDINRTNGRFDFGGAIYSANPVKGTRYLIAARACVNGDLDATSAGAGLTSIFVNGLKGTDSFYTGSNATPGGVAFLGQNTYVDATSATVGGLVALDGYILRLEVRPYAMTDAECIRWTGG
jgi:hypothetical protein